MADKKKYYLLGIGGIGMSALARYYLSLGHKIAGYDRVRSPLCEQLEAEGMLIHYQDSVAAIPAPFKDKENCHVIYTPAIPNDLAELEYFKKNEFVLEKRAKVLGDISKKHICLAVAGTHGKTTTSALLAHLFKSNGHSVFAFLGGISSNYNTNFIAGKADSILIAEADEYDRSFLSLSPAGGIITSIDADHLDVYGESKELENTFGQFKDRIEKIAIVHENTKLKGLTYSIEGSTSYSGRNVRIENHNYTFDLILPSGDMIENISSGLPGRHNLENAIAAAALALNFGLTSEEVSKGIASFKGVKRRFDYHIKSPELVYIDDYAHHPAEINALIGSIRELYPNKKITAIFQPHLFSRTRDFADDFAASLSEVDELILMDIFPAREKPIPGISSSMLLSKVQLENKHHFSAQEILTHVGYNKPEVIVTIGAGDIGMLVNQLKMKLLQ